MEGRLFDRKRALCLHIFSETMAAESGEGKEKAVAAGVSWYRICTSRRYSCLWNNARQ